MQIHKIHNFAYVLSKAAVFEIYIVICIHIHIQIYIYIVLKYIVSNGFTVYTAGADSDYRNVRTCETWKFLLVKNRVKVVENREILDKIGKPGNFEEVLFFFFAVSAPDTAWFNINKNSSYTVEFPTNKHHRCRVNVSIVSIRLWLIASAFLKVLQFKPQFWNFSFETLTRN